MFFNTFKKLLPSAAILLTSLAFAPAGAAGTEPAATLTKTDWQAIRAQLKSAQQPTFLKASNTDASDEFGYAVAVSADTVVVGAYQEDSSGDGLLGGQLDNSASSAGAVYVFVLTETGWEQQAYLKASNADPNDQFGFSVAISGDTIVVGARYEQSNGFGLSGSPSDNSLYGAGAAYVFIRSDGVWSEQAYLKAPVPGYRHNFGHAVAISGDLIVVGVPYDGSNATQVDGPHNHLAGSSGAAYVFQRTGSYWGAAAFLKPSNTGAGDRFGSAVAISGETILVGAPYEDSAATGTGGAQQNNSVIDSGAAYVFERVGGWWTQQAYLKASNTYITNYFGSSVAVSGDTVVVGAPRENSPGRGVDATQSQSGTWLGAAYVFSRDNGSWGQEAYLKASNADNYDEFGTSVAISGDLVVVGAPYEDGPSDGIGGDEGNATARSQSGAAYLFARSSSGWSQVAYLKASNSMGSILLGVSTAISGSRVIAGANNEASPTTGVDNVPDPALPLANYSGAAYVYDLAAFVPAGSTTGP